jgi:proline iminopeptidase
LRFLAFLALLIAVAGCGARGSRPAPIPLGESRLAVPGGRIWFRVTGTDRGLPLVLVHGGPGFSSYYLKPLEALGDERIVVRYDQLGSGKSDSLADTTMFTIAHFVDELDSLRAHLGIQKWHVYGHSWGTIVGIEYYRAHPEHVASLIFAGPVFDMRAYGRRASELVQTLSDSSQRAVKNALATGRFDAPAYQNAVGEFWGRYVFRHPVQADLDSSLASFNQHLYEYMQGPSEFTITGTLAGYDAKPFLKEINVPTLVTVGEFDEVGPELARSHAALIPGARFTIFPGAAHLTTWDVPESTVAVVREFLRSADGPVAARR